MGAWVKTELILSRVCAAIIAICGVVCNVLRGYIFKAQHHSVWKYFKKSHFINSFIKTLVTLLCLVYFDSQNIYGTHIWGQNPVKPGPPMMKFVYTQSLRCCLNCIRATVNDKKSNVRWINRLRKAAGKTRVEQRISNGDSSTRLPSPSSAKKKFTSIFLLSSCRCHVLIKIVIILGFEVFWWMGIRTSISLCCFNVSHVVWIFFFDVLIRLQHRKKWIHSHVCKPPRVITLTEVLLFN